MLHLLYRINDIQNITLAMETLIQCLDPTCGRDVDKEANGEVTMVTLQRVHTLYR